jgi:hypothetical protein
MKFIWKPFWYDLDQTLIVGEEGYFYIIKESNIFSNGLSNDNEIEIKGKVKSIYSIELGELKGIICDGLDYFIHLSNGSVITVDSEQELGKVQNSDMRLLLSIEVDIEVMDYTGGTAKTRRYSMTRQEFKEYWNCRRKGWQILLDN